MHACASHFPCQYFQAFPTKLNIPAYHVLRVDQMRVDRKVNEVRKRFSLEKEFIIQEKGMKRLIIVKPYQINKRENWNIFCPQAFKLALKVGRMSSTTCSVRSLSPGTKIVVPFTTCSSSSKNIQNSRVEHKMKIDLRLSMTE